MVVASPRQTMTHRNYSRNSGSLSMMSPQGSANGGRKQKSRVDWVVEWIEPAQTGATGTSLMQDAERRLSEIARQAVHHAVVSGSATITIKVVRGKPVRETR